MTATRVINYGVDAHAFLQHAEPWLLRNEAEYNLILGIAANVAATPAAWERPLYFAVVESNGKVVGCAMRTPPWKLAVTRMPPAMVKLVVENVVQIYDNIPSVIGPPETSLAFATLIARSKGGQARPGMRQRIYQLDRVIEPPRRATGELHVATDVDVDLIVEWVRAFGRETAMNLHRVEETTRSRIALGEVFLWNDAGRPVSLAAWAGKSPNGVRIGYVYTPPELRARGYASACVAEVSQYALDSGRQFCFLYTDASNETSNSIYQSIGYRPVADSMDTLILRDTIR